VRPITRAFLALILLLMAACDPGIAIRQFHPKAGNGATLGVAIRVRTINSMIGETHYAPQVEIANSSDSPIYVTRVELDSQGTVFQNKPQRPGSYPSEVQPGRTETLDIWFRLANDVKKTFRKPAELRVYYRSGDKQQIARTSLMGGSLGP
jgi:hypothetical protein